MALLFDSGIFSIEGLGGEVLPGAKLYWYTSGTSTPQATYADDDLTVPNANPVIANADGRFPPIWLQSLDYKLVLKTFDDVTLVTRDPVLGYVGAGLVNAGSLPTDNTGLQGIIDKLQPQQKYWITRYGADTTGTSAVDTAFAAWRQAIADQTDSPSANLKFSPPGYVPKGTYLLNTNQELPYNVDSYGRFVGAGVLSATNFTDARINGIYAAGLVARGQYNSVFDGVYSPLTVKGGGTNQGTFWTEFRNVNNTVNIDLTDWSVNHNLFQGVKGNFSITGTTGNLRDGHANLLVNVDVTSGTGTGLSNTSSLAQTNYALGVYYEGGKTIFGPWHVLCFHGDAGGPPSISRDHHALFSTNVIEKNSGDFFASATGNLAQGGEWDYLDSTGKPVCLGFMSPASSSVGADATEPFVGSSAQGSFTAALSGYSIVLPKTSSGRFALVLAFVSPTGASFSSIEINRGGGDITFGGASEVGTANGWRLLRISGKASTTGNTIIRLYAQGGSPSGSVTFKIGAIRATQEKAVMLPSAQPLRRIDPGIAVNGKAVVAAGTNQATVSGGSAVDVVVNFGTTFTGSPEVIVGAPAVTGSAAETGNFTKMMVTLITTTSCTVRVFYTTSFSGRVAVTAIGDLA